MLCDAHSATCHNHHKQGGMRNNIELPNFMK